MNQYLRAYRAALLYSKGRITVYTAIWMIKKVFDAEYLLENPITAESWAEQLLYGAMNQAGL